MGGALCGMVSRNTAHGMHNDSILFFQRPGVLCKASGFFIEGFDMVKLEPGMLIETNYSGPYRIVSVSRGCTCKQPLALINNMGDEDKVPDRPEHIHLVLTDPEETWRSDNYAYLNGYDEETLKSLDFYYDDDDKLKQDWITILKQDKPVQKTLFD